VRRLLTTTATILTVVAGLAVTSSTGPAFAAEGDEGPVRVAITGLSPIAPGPNSTIIVTGNLSNTGFDDLDLVSVRLSLSSAPLPDRRSIRQAVEGSEDLTDYALYATETLVSKRLRAGGTERFEVRAKAADLLLPEPGVYALSVEAVGTGPAGYTTLGTAHTTLPWLPDQTSPVRLTWLWPFATWPGQTANGVFLGDLLPRELDSGGRLSNILDAAASASDLVTWVVDPQLLQATSDLEEGYLVEEDGQVRPGTQQGAARRWREEFQAATAEAERTRGRAPRPAPSLWDLPYADIDADAVERAKLDGDVIRAVTSAPAVTRENLGRPAEGTFYWAPGGRVSQGTLDVLASSGVQAVILRDNALPPLPAVDYTPSGYADLDTRFGTVRALLVDSSLLDALTMPQGNRSEIIALRQRVLSELAFVSLEGGKETRHLVAAAGSTRWDPDPLMLRVLLTSLRAAPWTRLIPVDEVLSLPPAPLSRVTTDYDSKSRGRELEEAYMARVKQAQEDLSSIRSVVVNPIGISEPISAALLRTVSSAWRTRRDNSPGRSVPGKTTGPPSPPASNPSRESSRNEANAVSGPWQPMQRSARSGRTRRSKVSATSASAAVVAAAGSLPPVGGDATSVGIAPAKATIASAIRPDDPRGRAMGCPHRMPTVCDSPTVYPAAYPAARPSHPTETRRRPPRAAAAVRRVRQVFRPRYKSFIVPPPRGGCVAGRRKPRAACAAPSSRRLGCPPARVSGGRCPMIPVPRLRTASRSPAPEESPWIPAPVSRAAAFSVGEPSVPERWPGRPSPRRW